MKLMSRVARGVTAIVLTCGLTPFPRAYAQEVFAYPEAGQSEQQQMQDDLECHEWSVRRTGFDPNKPPKALST